MPFSDSELFLKPGEQPQGQEQQRLSTTDLGEHFVYAAVRHMQDEARGTQPTITANEYLQQQQVVTQQWEAVNDAPQTT
ncbi:MAG TPA: hypothetical protein VHT70_04585 [Candidatus Saccharimonadales bacterium]|jgi:hypothetical protein|nr:hypothetical protein [Candidatus Saccharimonadales bacterium]